MTVDPDIVGLNTKGNGVLPNGGDGLLIAGTAHGNVIGGTLVSVIPQNTFSGNLGYRVAITGRAHNNHSGRREAAGPLGRMFLMVPNGPGAAVVGRVFTLGAR